MAYPSTKSRFYKILSISAILFSTCILPLRGANDEEVEKSTLEDMKKIKCFYRELVTCGISNDETPCIDYPVQIQILHNDITGKTLQQMKDHGRFRDKEGVNETIDWMTDWRNIEKQVCSVALNLNCVKGRCTNEFQCQNWNSNTCYHLKQISEASDWKEDNNDCGEPNGEEYKKCPVELKIKTTTTEAPKSSRYDLNRIKCLYKKIVTCGLTEVDTEENDYPCTDHDLEGVKRIAENIAGLSTDTLQRDKYKTPEEAKAAIKWLEEFEPKSRSMCAIHRGLFCNKGSCQVNCEDKPLCDHLKKISGQYDWNTNDYCEYKYTKCEPKPEKTVGSEDAKYFMKKLQELFRESGADEGQDCQAEYSSNMLIQYAHKLGESAEDILNWLERHKGLQTHSQARNFTNEFFRNPRAICAAGKGLVCVPARLGLKEWNYASGRCKSCDEVKRDSTYDRDVKSVCTQYVDKLQLVKVEVTNEFGNGTLPPEAPAEADDYARGNLIPVHLGKFQIVFFLMTSFLYVRLISFG